MSTACIVITEPLQTPATSSCANRRVKAHPRRPSRQGTLPTSAIFTSQEEKGRDKPYFQTTECRASIVCNCWSSRDCCSSRALERSAAVHICEGLHVCKRVCLPCWPTQRWVQQLNSHLLSGPGHSQGPNHGRRHHRWRPGPETRPPPFLVHSKMRVQGHALLALQKAV
jgi:hypothetical protein